MKFSCSKELLAKQLQHVGRAVSPRVNMPILSNLLLETDKKILRISSTDLELAITTHIPAKITQEGSFTVPARMFQDFVTQNPDEEIYFDLESFELVCHSDKVDARITGMDPKDYPELPKVEKAKTVRLPLKDFNEAMKRVIIACAQDPSRPVLNAVYVHLSDATATFAATDSFRLVERQIKIVPIQDDITLLLPIRSIQEVIRIVATLPESGDLEMEINEKQVLFRLGNLELFSRLVTGAFPKYQAIIPTSFQCLADVTTQELIQALRLTYVFSQSGVANVLFEITEDGKMLLSSYGSQRGSSKHVIYAVLQEGFTPLKVAFNAKYLVDALSATGAQYVKLSFSGPTTAMVIMTELPNYTQLVMPIRLES